MTRHILRSFCAIEKVPKPKRKAEENRGPKFDQRGVGKRLLLLLFFPFPFQLLLFSVSPSFLPRAISFLFEEREKGTKMRFSNIVGSGSSKRLLLLLLLRPPAAAHLYSSALALFFALEEGVGGRKRTYWPVAASLPWLAALPREKEEKECLLSKPPSLLHRRGEGRGLLATSFLGGRWGNGCEHAPSVP